MKGMLPCDILFCFMFLNGNYIQGIPQHLETSFQPTECLCTPLRFHLINSGSSLDSSWVKKWKPELVSAGDPGVLPEAQQFVQNMRDSGMTNINEALVTAVKEFIGLKDTGRASLVFFLTDGQPTEGVTDSKLIVQNVQKANVKDVAILSLAFGSGADFEALKTISAQNSGFARKIYEASDAALQVSSLYNEVSAVVMMDLTVSYLPSSVDKFTVTETTFPVVYNGTEVVICGVMPRSEGRFVAEISGLKKSGEVDLVFETDDVTNFIIEEDDEDNKAFSKPRDYAGLVERMWAYLTIKQLLKAREKEANNEKKSEELKQRIIKMSLKYRLVTPLTSMVVTKPDSVEKSQASLEDADSVKDIPRPHGARGSMHGQVYVAGLPSSHSAHYTSLVSAKHSVAFGQGHPQVQRSSVSYSDPAHGHRRQSVKPLWKKARNQRGRQRHRGKKFMPPPTQQVFTRTTMPQTTASKPIPQKGSLLSALVVHSSSLKACAVLRKLLPGNYTLLNYANGTSVSMSTSCPSSKCRIPGLITLNLQGPAGKATVMIEKSKYSLWTYSASSGYDVISSGGAEALTVEGPDATVVISRTSTRKAYRYLVTVTVDDRSTHEGLIDSVIALGKKSQRKKKSHSNKKRKQRTPRACRKTGSDYSGTLKRRATRTYRL